MAVRSYSSYKKGDKYNRLTAIQFSHIGDRYKKYWVYRCECGRKATIRCDQVRSGVAKSCGCILREYNSTGRSNFSHGFSGKRFWRIWTLMKNRTKESNKNNKLYKYWAGKDIKTCKSWTKSFINFKRDMYKSYVIHSNIFGEKNTTIDRIDGNKGYSKHNCRWATYKVQANNITK